MPRFRVTAVLLALAALPVAAQDRVYRHPDGYFELVPPLGWEFRISYNGMEFQAVFHPAGAEAEDPETAFRVLFIPLAEGEDRARLEARIADLTRDVARSVLEPTSGRVVAERSEVVAGRPAHYLEVEQTNDEGRELQGGVIGTVGPAIFFLIYYAPRDRWSEFDPVFDRILDSFAHRPAKLAPEAPSDFIVVYQDPEGAFRLERPDNWIPQITREGESLRYHFVPKRSVQMGEEPLVVFTVQHFEAAGSPSLGQSAADLKKRMLEKDPNLRLVRESEEKIGELTAVRIRLNRRPDEGTQSIREDLYVLTKGSRVYVLVAAAPDGLYPTHEPAFTRMIQSFRIP